MAAKSTVDFIVNREEYIKNNIVVTNNILRSIKNNKTKHLIFASTAAVYKSSKKNLTENSTLKANNIYGKTKLICEKKIIRTLKEENIIFRFFNVCSSLIKLKIGEIHNPETHLVPILSKKFQENKKIYIYGNKFKTRDKTCIRDYIHIADIMSAFYKGIQYLIKNKKSEIINLGTRNGYSNLEVFKAFAKMYNYNYTNPFFKKKRLGDIDRLVCDNKKSYKILKWAPKKSNIIKIISDEKKWLNFLIKKKIYRKTIY